MKKVVCFLLHTSTELLTSAGFTVTSIAGYLQHPERARQERFSLELQILVQYVVYYTSVNFP